MCYLSCSLNSLQLDPSVIKGMLHLPQNLNSYSFLLQEERHHKTPNFTSRRNSSISFRKALSALGTALPTTGTALSASETALSVPGNLVQLQEQLTQIQEQLYQLQEQPYQLQEQNSSLTFKHLFQLTFINSLPGLRTNSRLSLRNSFRCSFR